jgi:hypothetical protein
MSQKLSFASASAATVTSVAFQASLAIWPDLLKEYTWMVKYIWGLAVALWIVTGILYFLRAPRPDLTQSQSPSSTPQALASGITFNISPTISSQINPVIKQHSDLAPSVAPPLRRATTPEPNLIFLSTRTIHVRYAEPELYSLGVFSESSMSGNDPAAVVACFRNEPRDDSRVAEAAHVRAQILCRNSHGNEIGMGASRACWLEEEHDFVDIAVGESRCVMLSVFYGGKVILLTRKRARKGGYDEVSKPVVVELSEVPTELELRLIADLTGETLVSPIVFEFELTDSKPRAARRL